MFLISLCPTPACSGGKEWQDCGTACPLTCDNYNTTFGCTEQCVSGCFCPQGLVDLYGVCVDPSYCSGRLTISSLLKKEDWLLYHYCVYTLLTNHDSFQVVCACVGDT